LNEITPLNRENVRLIVEMRESRKLVSAHETKITNLESSLRKNEDDYKIKCQDLEATTENNKQSEELTTLSDELKAREAKV
jgi:hypothetical protein